MVDGGGLCFRVPMFCSAMRKHPAAAVPTRASLCYNHTCTHCTHAAATLMSPHTHTHTHMLTHTHTRTHTHTHTHTHAHRDTHTHIHTRTHTHMLPNTHMSQSSSISLCTHPHP